MPTTSNFGWTTPADTDLVKDGAAAIRTLGNGIDTSLLDLKGGTTNQVLAKNSNTDLDFKWVADASGIPATILDAKGDIIAATAADTADRLAVGADGTVLTADSTTATGLKWAAPASGGMTELATGSLTSTSVTISAISGSYKDLVLVIRNYRPTTTDLKLMMRVNGSSSAIYKATPGIFTAATTFADTETFISTTADGGAASQALIYVYVPDYANTATWKFWRYESLVNNETTNTSGAWEADYGLVKTTSAITSITLLPQAGGSFSSGTYILYGVK